MKQLIYGIKYMTNYWLFGKKDPLICGLVLHNACNLNCRHCTIVDRPAKRMTFQEAMKVMDDFYKEGGRCLYLEGGEPFIWRDRKYQMEDIVRYAKEKGYLAVIIYTNGTRPLESEADTIFISVDGLKETHDYIRGTSFEQIMENIRKSNHPSLYINYTINSINRPEIADFCAYINEIPQINGVFFYFHTPYYGYDELFLNAKAKEDVLLEILQLKKKYKILNSRAGIYSAMRGTWEKRLKTCRVYEGGVYYDCCRENKQGSVCKDCGYLSYAEIDQTLKLKPGAIMNALKYF